MKTQLSFLKLPETLKLAGDDMAVHILRALSRGSLRYSEFTLSGSSKTLSKRLKLLEQKGLLTRTLHAEVPPRVVYALTEKGEEFLSIVDGVAKWEDMWAQR